MPYRRSASQNQDSRYQWLPSDRGYLAEVLPLHLVDGSTAPTVAGRLEFARIRLPFGGSVTNVLMFASAGGSALTSGQNFAALHTSGGVLIGQSADQTTPWASSGLKTMALSGGPYSLPGGEYYVDFWYNGTTAPTWVRGANTTAVNASKSAPNLLWGSADTGLTTTAPPNMGGQTAQSLAFWVALS